jgi:two-component system osmolarity sensor histidine kinase EnvZ
MDAMLAQFLDFARGIDGEALQPVDLGEVARLAIEGLEADVVVSGDAGPAVSVRPFTIQRAITNLVRNAMLHGAPPVTVTFEHSDNQVSIIVSDAGKGVDPALLATLAQPFVRGDPARGGAAGTGLGLAIVRHVAEQHHGALRFRNIESGGFAATLTLPVFGPTPPNQAVRHTR